MASKIRQTKLARLEAAWRSLRNSTELNLDEMEPDTHDAVDEMDTAVCAVAEDFILVRQAAEEAIAACRDIVDSWESGDLAKAARRCKAAIRKLR